MGSHKKGVDIPEIIVLFVIGLILLLFGYSLIKHVHNSAASAGTCTGRGFSCIERTETGGCPSGYHEQFGMSGCTSTQLCCESDNPASITQAQALQLSAKEQTALTNGLIVTLGDSPTPLSQGVTIPLKVSSQYSFKITVNDQLKSASSKLGRYCAVYVTDANDRSKTYDLSKIAGEGLKNPVETDVSNQIFPCAPGQVISRLYQPSAIDAFKSLTLYVIYLDQNASDAFDDYGYDFSNFESMYSNTQHWLVWRAYQLNVEPVIKISGMSTDWAAKNVVTLSCNGITCKSFAVKLVQAQSNGNFNDLFNACSTDSNYLSTLDYVSGTTVQSSGIPLNINLGGFRLPYQQRIMYITSTSPITVVNNKAQITIDKATMIKDFGSYDQNLLTGDKTYLCVKAIPDGANAAPVYGVSSTPLKVDAIPPYVDPENIRVVFPDPVTAINASTPYYYREYPRVVVGGCYDWGQSGCTNYDYYIKEGSFINLNSNTADWQSGVVGLLLTEGVNSLITYFASKDAANTICPLMTSNSFIRNSNPEIRFLGSGQAIVCIRIGDRVGNTQLVWKPIWSPAEMVNRILVNQLT